MFKNKESNTIEACFFIKHKFIFYSTNIDWSVLHIRIIKSEHM